jgi:hypothetical protein
MKNFLNLTKDEFYKEKFPVKEILAESLYYPACEFDGNIVKCFSKEVQSFVYCDYATGEEALLKQIDSFKGYNVFASRHINENEITPNGFASHIPKELITERYNMYSDVKKTPFANWTIYERTDEFDENHGPKRFSILYIGGEAVATYQALYWTIRPGTGYGFNWTDFREQNQALGWVVLNNPNGIPEKILTDTDTEHFKWDRYVFTNKIEHYKRETAPLNIFTKTK